MLCIAGGLQPVAAKTLRIALREDVDTLDPTLSGSYVGRIVFAGMCDKLFDYDTKLNIVPQLAAGYTYKDPTHLILHLRPGVKFQDGESFDASAVKYTLMRDLTMKGSLRKGQINDITAINVIDPFDGRDRVPIRRRRRSTFRRSSRCRATSPRRASSLLRPGSSRRSRSSSWCRTPLELVKKTGETVDMTLILMSEWKAKLPTYLKP
ncbi:MAG: ABC transporter substrate-binding protein [Bradyrhizobium sp.]